MISRGSLAWENLREKHGFVFVHGCIGFEPKGKCWQTVRPAAWVGKKPKKHNSVRLVEQQCLKNTFTGLSKS